MIRINPGNVDAYYERGKACHKKRDYDRAITDYNKVIQFNPNSAPLYSMRGIAYMEKGNYDMAIADWEAALRIDPNDRISRDNIEMARNKRGI
jgi:tetratricopeptide (TPR) repeat protein